MTKRSLSVAAALALAIVSTASAQVAMKAGNPRTGKAFALQTCTLCHVVSSHQLSPPRVGKAPSFRAIANMNSTTAMSLRVFLTTPHPTMPNLMLTPDETANVIAYILTLRDPR